MLSFASTISYFMTLPRRSARLATLACASSASSAPNSSASRGVSKNASRSRRAASRQKQLANGTTSNSPSQIPGTHAASSISVRNLSTPDGNSFVESSDTKDLASQHANQIVSVFPALADETAANAMAVYVKGQFTFYGIAAPARRAATKGLISAMKEDVGADAMLPMKVALALWEYSEREAQYAALDVLCRYEKAWVNAACVREVLRITECLSRSKQWWDTIDCLSSNVVGPLLRKDAEYVKSVLQKWIVDDDVWIRRVAILAQLRSGKETDEQMLFEFVKLRMNDTEFWIRKAIGWALRSYRRSNEEAVDIFVEENRQNMSPLSVREAWKHKR